VRDSFVLRTRWLRPSAEPDANSIARRGLLNTTDNDSFMQSTEGRIVKNVRFMLAGQIITWVLSLAWVIYIPGYVGATNMGRFAIGGAIWSILIGIIGSGVPTYLIKEIARSPEAAPRLLGTALLQRYLIFLACCPPVAAYIYFMGYSPETTLLIWLMAIGVPAQHTNFVLNSIFQGLEVMQYVSFVDIITKIMTVGSALILMLLKFSVNEIVAASSLSIILGVIVQVVILRRFMPIRLTWSNKLSGELLLRSVPYCLSALVLMLYGEIDKLIMSSMVEERTVGWYGIAATLAGTFVFLPNILATAIFPAVSRGAEEKTNDAVHILRKSLDVTLIAGVPIGFGLAIIADPLVDLVYRSKFPESGPVLSVMSVSLILTYVTTILGRFLVAAGRTNLWTFAMFVCVVLAFPLNFIFVGWTESQYGNGAIGGALRFASTEFIMAMFALYLLPRGTLSWANARTALRVLCAGGVMLVSCWLVRHMFIAVPIVIGMVTYTAMILILRVLQPEDIGMIQGGWRSALAAVGRRTDGPRVSGAGKIQQP
jgi:O-antigen/teichoic acid export membrane protein